MKYMLFAYDSCWPSGGMNDFEGLFNSIQEAERYFVMEEGGQCWELGQIVNATSLVVEKELCRED